MKAILVQMLEAGKLTDDPLHQYCCSWLVVQVANIGLNRFIAAWNSHRIPGVLANSYLQVACVNCNLYMTTPLPCICFILHTYRSQRRHSKRNSKWSSLPRWPSQEDRTGFIASSLVCSHQLWEWWRSYHCTKTLWIWSSCRRRFENEYERASFPSQVLIWKHIWLHS